MGKICGGIRHVGRIFIFMRRKSRTPGSNPRGCTSQTEGAFFRGSSPSSTGARVTPSFLSPLLVHNHHVITSLLHYPGRGGIVISAPVCEVSSRVRPRGAEFSPHKKKTSPISNTRTSHHHTPDTFPRLNSEAG